MHSTLRAINGVIELVLENDVYHPDMVTGILGKYRTESVEVKNAESDSSHKRFQNHYTLF
jgi:hypothetical protein